MILDTVDTLRVRRNFVRDATRPFVIEPRRRELRVQFGAAGGGAVVPVPGAPAGVGAESCIGLGGESISLAATPAGGTTNVTRSSRIGYPFVITHINFASAGTSSDVINVSFYVWDDDSTVYADRIGWTGVQGSQSNPLFFPPVGLTTPRDFYPNFVWQSAEGRIKMAIDNQVLAPREVRAIVDIMRL